MRQKHLQQGKDNPEKKCPNIKKMPKCTIADIFGGVTHFNSRGEEIGYSMPDKTGVMVDPMLPAISSVTADIFGGATHFDAKAERPGTAIRTTGRDLTQGQERT